MECYIIYIYNTEGLIKKLVVIDGNNDKCGKYIKSNVKEMYHFYMAISLNISKINKDLNILEVALQKAYKESYPFGYKQSKQSKQNLISNIKINIKEIDESKLIDLFNSSHGGKDTVKVVNYTKTLGKKSSIYDYNMQ